MKEIHNKKQLDEYCSRYQIPSHFSEWDRMKKKLVRYEKGEMIGLYGEKPDKLYFLVKGMIRFTCIAGNFEEYFFFDATNNGLFGEVEYVMDIPLITQSEVLEDCECIVIPIRENRQILDQDLIFQKFIAQVLAQKYNDMRNQYMDVETTTLRIRLAEYLCSINSQSETIPNLGLLAKYLRCSYRHLLREMKYFCENGCLVHLEQKGRYKIADEAKLRAYIDQSGS